MTILEHKVEDGQQKWQTIAQEAQQRRDESVAKIFKDLPPIEDSLPTNVTAIPKSILSPAEIEITERDPEQLLPLLAEQRITSVAVTEAFLRRAAIAQRLSNCVTELLPERALVRANALDDHIKRHGKPVGPLHGLPISVKEHIGMKSLTLTGGFCSQAENIATSDATLLRILYRAGAVFFVRTTEPQTMMHLETSSNMYGITVNPYNSKLTAGGSSGGEGALQALRGSVLGIGSDIGGSIRSPAANNGLYGLKPSADRIPKAGTSFAMKGNELVLGAYGPISTSLYGIKVFMEAVINQRPWELEPWLNPIPWREWKEAFDPSRKLRIGVMWDDGVVRPHPPVRRALDELVEKLRHDSQVEVVDWMPWKHDYAWDLTSRLYFPDGGRAELDCIHASGEPLRPLSKFILQERPGIEELRAREIWALTNERNQYRAEYHAKWNATATHVDGNGHPVGMVDAILCPAGPGAAPPLDCSKYWAYTSQWNLLDYSAMVFPVTRVDATKDVADSSYTPRNQTDAYNHSLYSPDRYLDAPVSLQLVTRRYQEEKLIGVMEFIQNLL